MLFQKEGWVCVCVYPVINCQLFLLISLCHVLIWLCVCRSSPYLPSLRRLVMPALRASMCSARVAAPAKKSLLSLTTHSGKQNRSKQMNCMGVWCFCSKWLVIIWFCNKTWIYIFTGQAQPSTSLFFLRYKTFPKRLPTEHDPILHVSTLKRSCVLIGQFLVVHPCFTLFSPYWTPPSLYISLFSQAHGPSIQRPLL